MCLKIGGWVRAEYAYGDNGNLAWGWANGNVNNRTTNNSTWRARGYITADARNQTEYGTVRGYIAVGLSTSTAATSTVPATRSCQPRLHPVGRLHLRSGAVVLSISTACLRRHTGARSRRLTPAIRAGKCSAIRLSSATASRPRSPPKCAARRRSYNSGHGHVCARARHHSPAAYGGFQAPDIVANLRVDQAWGSAQIMGALHQVNATYYVRLLATSLDPSQWSSRRQVGLCYWRRHQAERSNDRPGRLLSGPGQLHPGCPAVRLPDAQLELGQGRRGG